MKHSHTEHKDYLRTEMYSCPLCYVCYQGKADVQKHILSNHPDFKEKMQEKR